MDQKRVILGKALMRSLDELDTAQEELKIAADTILSIAEKLMAEESDAGRTSELTRLMEICSFNDLVGQRLTQVRELMNFLFSNADRLFHDADHDRFTRLDSLVVARGPATLQDKADRSGLGQGEIDALLANLPGKSSEAAWRPGRGRVTKKE
ncbi:MAG: hypothetical protein FJX46_17600 [Alphaproteobacteria bacterium]|nr:hypothetical protein [Alphaproteobacteria bacterium]